MTETLFEPWPTPADWTWKTLADVCGVMRAGGTPSAKNDSFYGGDIPFAKVEDVVDSLGVLSRTNHSLTQAGLDASSAWVVPPGSVLYTMYASYGVPAINAVPVATNQAIIALRPFEQVVAPKFLYWFLCGIRNRIAGKAIGTTQANLSKKLVAAFPIPVPPLSEQERIVGRIDELMSDVDAGLTSVGLVGARRSHMKAAVLESAFSGGMLGLSADAATGLPEGWRWSSLGDPLVGEVRGGLTKNARRNALPLKRPYLRVANVYADELRLEEMKEIGVTPEEAVRYLLKKDDLLVVEGNGSKEHIGRVALWNGATEDCLHQNHIIRVRLTTEMNPRFVLHWLLSPRGRQNIMDEAHTTSGLYTLSTGKVSSLRIPVADRAVQDRLVAEVDAQLSTTDKVHDEMAEVAAVGSVLRLAVLDAAFHGRI